mmetsp:Transcript_48531/g.71972  ORF Transcript_48531/g.71972 Transcript_48531/m.71972 type:complete len:355 (-) Transcript_48531:126-1190(-)
MSLAKRVLSDWSAAICFCIANSFLLAAGFFFSDDAACCSRPSSSLTSFSNCVFSSKSFCGIPSPPSRDACTSPSSFCNPSFSRVSFFCNLRASSMSSVYFSLLSVISSANSCSIWACSAYSFPCASISNAMSALASSKFSAKDSTSTSYCSMRSSYSYNVSIMSSIISSCSRKIASLMCDCIAFLTQKLRFKLSNSCSPRAVSRFCFARSVLMALMAVSTSLRFTAGSTFGIGGGASFGVFTLEVFFTFFADFADLVDDAFFVFGVEVSSPFFTFLTFLSVADFLGVLPSLLVFGVFKDFFGDLADDLLDDFFGVLSAFEVRGGFSVFDDRDVLTFMVFFGFSSGMVRRQRKVQ